MTSLTSRSACSTRCEKTGRYRAIGERRTPVRRGLVEASLEPARRSIISTYLIAADADVGQVTAKCGLNLSGSRRVLHTVGMIRIGTSADLGAATGVYRRASLSNAGDRDKLLAHPEYLVLGPEGLAEGRTHVAEEDGSLVGFATWIETAGTMELEDLFVEPGYRRRGIAAALVNRIVDVLRARGVERLEVTANPHALGFYRAVGFIDCGVAETEFGAAPRMELVIS
jgi:GNAT superfamily N-acetyltransferase